MTDGTPAPESLFVTFQVTHEGEPGRPMDHITKRITVDPAGTPDDTSMSRLADSVRQEITRKANLAGRYRPEPTGTVSAANVPAALRSGLDGLRRAVQLRDRCRAAAVAAGVRLDVPMSPVQANIAFDAMLDLIREHDEGDSTTRPGAGGDR